jgi:hypothetical protein
MRLLGASVQRSPRSPGSTAAGNASESVGSYLSTANGSGQPLSPVLRAYFEPRFGRDFSDVRIHTNHRAADSARSIDANAYTMGTNIVFGRGQHAPNTTTGRRLLAHELAHVVQQTSGGQGSHDDHRVQRSCGPAEIGTPPGCTNVEGDVVGERFLFRVNCDLLHPGEASRLQAFSNTIKSGERIEIHGFASSDGDPVFNEHLSCARAIKASEIMSTVFTSVGTAASISLFNHGATKGKKPHEQRAVLITRSGLAPPPPPPPPVPSACNIDVRATHIGGALSAAPIWHLFIIHTEVHTGSTYSRYFRGGPGGTCAGVAPGSHGTIATDTGGYFPGTVDWDPAAPSVTAETGKPACAKIACLKSEVGRIDSTCTPYSPTGPNSNTVASTLLNKCGIRRVKPVTVTPGWDDPDL